MFSPMFVLYLWLCTVFMVCALFFFYIYGFKFKTIFHSNHNNLNHSYVSSTMVNGSTDRNFCIN